MGGEGRRERKRQQTRDAVIDAAWRLFVEKGFDAVTVAEIAEAADIDRKTVYNHFETKEDLVFHRGFDADLLVAIRNRPAGETILEAFAHLVSERWDLYHDGRREHTRVVLEHHRVVAGSAALRVREQQLFDRYTDQLATMIAEDSYTNTDALTSWIAANALIGVLRALLSYDRDAILAGESLDKIAAGVRDRAASAFELLNTGLGWLGAAEPTQTGVTVSQT